MFQQATWKMQSSWTILQPVSNQMIPYKTLWWRWDVNVFTQNPQMEHHGLITVGKHQVYCHLAGLGKGQYFYLKFHWTRNAAGKQDKSSVGRLKANGTHSCLKRLLQSMVLKDGKADLSNVI